MKIKNIALLSIATLGFDTVFSAQLSLAPEVLQSIATDMVNKTKVISEQPLLEASLCSSFSSYPDWQSSLVPAATLMAHARGLAPVFLISLYRCLLSAEFRETRTVSYEVQSNQIAQYLNGYTEHLEPKTPLNVWFPLKYVTWLALVDQISTEIRSQSTFSGELRTQLANLISYSANLNDTPEKLPASNFQTHWMDYVERQMSNAKKHFDDLQKNIGQN